MITSIAFHEFVQAFQDYDRGNQFTQSGFTGLWTMLTDYEDETGEPIELDVIGLCCEYTEYGDAIECAKEYTDEQFEDESEALDWLDQRTQVMLLFNGGVIIQNF